MKTKKNSTEKSYLETKIEEIKEMYDLDEIEEIGGESRVLDVGEHICGEYLGIDETTDSDGQSIDLICIKTKDGNFSIKKSYQLGSVKNIETGQKIAILCYDKIKTESGRTFKKYKVWKVK